ncbi:MAG: hypothetical protein ACRDYU_12190 [Actinomycetes bacterium]
MRVVTLLVGQVVGLLVAIVVGLPRLVTGIVALAGRQGTDRVLRLRVVVQRDEAGAPVADLSDAQEAVAWAQECFRTQAGIRVVPVGWQRGDPLDVPADDPRFCAAADAPAGPPTLDVTCTTRAWRADLAAAGVGFRHAIRGQGGRTLPAYGAPVWAFAVRGFGTRHLGCSLGPLTDYVTVRFSGEPTTLAHELGHACGLWHTGANTLMHPKPSRTNALAAWQVWLVRASRHTTRGPAR